MILGKRASIAHPVCFHHLTSIPSAMTEWQTVRNKVRRRGLIRYVDWVVRYNNRHFQITPQSSHYAPARGKVVVWEWPHGTITIEYRGRALQWREIPAPVGPRERDPESTAERTRQGPWPLVKRRWVPPAHHPWREAARRAIEQRAKHAPNNAAVARPLLTSPSASP